MLWNGEGHEQQESVEISGEGNPEHTFAAGLSCVADLLAGVWHRVVLPWFPSLARRSLGLLRQKRENCHSICRICLTELKRFSSHSRQQEWRKFFWNCNCVCEDLDIGWFTALVHFLKTGQAFQIKQSMWQTPLGFDKQEMGMLDQMLSAGVIHYSHSEWASTPMLVRKCDGLWRYCIDFRVVNTVTE